MLNDVKDYLRAHHPELVTDLFAEKVLGHMRDEQTLEDQPVIGFAVEDALREILPD